LKKQGQHMSRIRSLTKKAKARPGLRILLWATLVAVLCGVSGAGEPLDIVLRAARGKLIDHQPSGKVVIVEVDDKHITGDDSDEKSKLYHAQLINKLSVMGAKNIIINMDASRYSDSVGDRALIAALKKSKTIFNYTIVQQSDVSEIITNQPAKQFLKYANISVDKLIFNELLFVDRIPNIFQTKLSTNYSTSRVIQKNLEMDYGSVHLDTIIDAKKIFHIDSNNIDQNSNQLLNKYIVVEYKSNNLSDKISAINNSNVYISSIIAISIETMLRGGSINISWTPMFFILFMYCAAVSFGNRISRTTQAQLLIILLTLIAPAWLDDNVIFSETVPALILLTWTIIGHNWMAFNLKRSRVNPGTGFANLNALRDLTLPVNMCLVVTRVQNFAEICAILPSDQQDDLAVQIVQRLSLGADGAAIYQGDNGVFAWVMSDDRQTPVHDTLEGLHALFSSPLQMGAHRLDLSLTFGIDKTNHRSVSNRLGSALVAAKEAAQAHVRWREYDPVALDTAEWKLSLVGELDEAIDKGQIWVAYQPKIDVVTGTISGAEALVRWSHPIRGEVGPVDFVMAAEAQNRISKLTNFVLDQALGIAAMVRQSNPDFTMAVNLSGRLLDAPNMIDTIEALLAQHDYPADKLTLEITESAAIESNAATKDFMAHLRHIGVKISIDDYGTGFSTLDYVTSIPASEIKIDRRFVSQMQTSQSDRVVVNSTIQLAHQLGRLAVAEGVEDAETLASLESMGCDVAQGYFISRPLTHEALFGLLAKQGAGERRLAG
jgi:diguanylate cyclase